MKRLMLAALIILGVSFFGWYMLIRIPPPEQGSGRGADKFCLDLLSKKNHREALSWVVQSTEGDIRTIGEQSPEDSIAFVKRLYEYGAKQVRALDIESYPNEGQSTNVLIVELPEQPEMRKLLFKVEARLAASEGYDPVSDDGQQYMFLSKFKRVFHL